MSHYIKYAISIALASFFTNKIMEVLDNADKSDSQR